MTKYEDWLFNVGYVAGMFAITSALLLVTIIIQI
jgi:hypothetical protein